MRLSIFMILLIVFCVSCQGLKYTPDESYLLPVDSGALEELIFIDGAPCKDLDGNIGACTKTIKSDRDLTFEIPPHPYGYSVDIICSRNINFEETYDVLKEKPFEITIPSNNFKEEKSFICIGEVFPTDREVVSHKFEIRARVVKKDYAERNEISIIEKSDKRVFVVLGQHSKYVRVFKEGKVIFKTKKTYIKVKKKDLKKLKISTESESGRFNYFNI